MWQADRELLLEDRIVKNHEKNISSVVAEGMEAGGQPEDGKESDIREACCRRKKIFSGGSENLYGKDPSDKSTHGHGGFRWREI